MPQAPDNAMLTELGKRLVSGSLSDAALPKATEATPSQGMPPYKLWEANPDVGRIPPQRTDTGCFLIAEVFGARRMIYVKDEDGLYTADPKKDRGATHIPRISVQELLARDLDDLVVERAVLELMLTARNIREIQLVNGLKPGQLTAALDGEPVGTIIFNDASGGTA